ncbi:hypothetical protein ACTXT7_017101, partial [Hymenolepis weldensis]
DSKEASGLVNWEKFSQQPINEVFAEAWLQTITEESADPVLHNKAKNGTAGSEPMSFRHDQRLCPG